MDLAGPFSWQKDSRLIRLQKSWDACEFEFNMSTIMKDLLEPTEVAPADQLFFRGQLLPLQQDPRLQLVQILSDQDGHHSAIGPVEQDVVNFRSCKLDQDSTIDAGLIDSRSSSFRSQHSNYWESGEKDSRDSSSSRCSNGSSQDSLFPAEKKPSANTEANSKACAAEVPNKSSQSTLKRWSWKSIFNGLKKVSKVLVDDKADEEQRRDSSGPETWSQKLTVFPLIGLRPPGKSLRSTSTGRASRGFNAHGKQQASFNYSTFGDGEHWKDMKRMSAGNPSAFTFRPKPKSSWHARERWQRCVDKVKPLYWKIYYPKHQYEAKTRESGNLTKMPTCDRAAASSCRSSSCTPLTKSPVRRDAEYMYNSSGKYLAVASCPASMRSSPHHSGVLAVVNNKSATSSSMHELHSAIQGAIAHCKQSQGGRSSSSTLQAEDGSGEG